MKYFAQEKSRAGNWVDSLGSNEIESCVGYCRWASSKGADCRIVERSDKEIAAFPAIAQQPKEREVA